MEKIANLLIWFVPFIFSLSFHEAAHAWMANRLGDPTAKFLGRLTLNPVAHADPIGTVLFPILSFFTGAPLIGWARPVPVNERNLKHFNRDGFLVAAAGPLSNLLLAVAFTLLLAVLVRIPGGRSDLSLAGFSILAPLGLMAHYGIQLNLVLALFNLVPIPPLDGGRVLSGLVPALAPQLRALERYGFVILLALFWTGLIGKLIFGPMTVIYGLLMRLVA